MSGALLAAASGVGFGVFQSLNARAVRGFDDPYLATLVQLAVAAVALSLAALLTGELGVRGIDAVDSPLAGLTVGLLGSVVVYAPLYLVVRRAQVPALTGEALGLKLLLGVLVGLATWWRWAALDDAEIGVVLALSLLSVPIVLFLAPVVAGRHLEHVTTRLGVGAGLVVAGGLTLVVA